MCFRFKQNIDETDLKQEKNNLKINISLWILKISRKKNEKRKSGDP
jgi:hypothetical protein